MSEEKRTFYKTLNNIVATNRIDNEEAYIINDYVSSLESIIKEVREYANSLTIYEHIKEDLLIIVDKENK